jgi:hypothetical protein
MYDSYILLIASSEEFFLYCYLGQCVINKVWFMVFLNSNHNFQIFQANEINESLYLSHWYNLENPLDRKRVLFILMMAGKEVGYSAGGFQNLSLKVYMEVMNLIL